MPITSAPGTIGGAFTPEDWANYVLEHLSAQSVVLASGATEIRTSLKTVHVPRITGDGGASWYGELEPIGPGDPTGDELTLTPKKVAAITTLSNEVVNDSSPSVLDAVGTAMTRAVALAADRAFLVGEGGKQPVGITTLEDVPSADADEIGYREIVTAAGAIRAAGGSPDVVYLSPADLTALQLATAGDDRPLIQPDARREMADTIAGLRIWATPALTAGTALVAEAAQIVVCVREDASVAVSEDALFTQDGTVCRVIARCDIGVGDANGLFLITPEATRASAATTRRTARGVAG